MVKHPPLPDEHPNDLKLIAASDDDWYPLTEPPDSPMKRVSQLPVHPFTSKCVHARLLSVHAVISVVPGSGEIRIPYLRRVDKGDFALFMDALTTEIDETTVRFTNVFMDDTDAAEAYDRLDRYLDQVAPHMNDVNDVDDKRRLEEVLDGFTHELEDWGHDLADTLVGQWHPNRPRTNSGHE